MSKNSEIDLEYSSYNESNETDELNEYDSNDEFESAADDILDFSQSNPFGTF